MSQGYLEIVTYKVETLSEADKQRAEACERIAKQPGFSGWLPLDGAQESKERADVVLWDSLAAAETAAEHVGTSDEFSAFRSTISDFGTMGHYKVPTEGLTFMSPGSGIEIGHFRLRSGIDEQTMRQAYTKMIANHLSQQPGWCAQRLVQLPDETFMDIAFAITEAQARDICQSWLGNAACEEFLALIDPISMEFGSFL